MQRRVAARVAAAAMATRDDARQAAVAAQVAMQADDPDGLALSANALNEIKVTQVFKLNNAALKWLRDTHENPMGFPTVETVELTDTDPLDIGVIEKPSGMDYSFKGRGERTPWSWRQMLAGMSAAAKDLVLGSRPRLGVVRIWCGPVLGSYDHKRWHAARHIGRPFEIGAPAPVWDFFVERTDGSVVRFHTNYANNKVEVADENEPRVLPGPPARGKGRSDGKGTYREKTSGNYSSNSRKVEDTHGGGDVARGSVFVDAAQGEGAGGGDVAGAAAGEGIADGDAADAAQGQDTHGGGDVARAGNVDTNVSLYRDAMDLVEEINAMSGEEQQALLNGLQLSLQGETIEESVAELQRSRSLGGLD